LWPADYVLQITYRLSADRLSLEARVENPDQHALPFGLGYHPYFHLRLSSQGQADSCQIEVKARSYWELENSLPTGKRLPVNESRDLNRIRPIGEISLDDILTDLPVTSADAKGLHLRATIRDAQDPLELRILCSDAFREMVVF